MSTLGPSLETDRSARPATPGLVHVFTAGVPTARVLRLRAGELELGRDEDTLGDLRDARMSRRHVRIRRSGSRFIVTDLGSQNGMWVDGVKIAPGETRELTRVLRIGESVFIPGLDLEPLERRGVVRDGGFVRGPAMQDVVAEVVSSARRGATLHIHGESGTGKEGMARAYHVASGRGDRPFVAVNCAAVPEAIAERLLFGSRRGAYSGADSDAPGYFQAADTGTLFLDEVVELSATVQAKLLRVLETREVSRLGEAASRRIDVAVCSATHHDLRALVGEGKLREDLFFRIGRPEVRLPPLRQRPEEIAHLVCQTSSRLVHASLVETCLLRPWPGNVRELLTEVAAAAQTSELQHAGRIDAQHLTAGAGTAFGEPDSSDKRLDASPIDTRAARPLDDETRERIIAALREHRGNVTAAARALGIHRTQLRRIVQRHGLVD